MSEGFYNQLIHKLKPHVLLCK